MDNQPLIPDLDPRRQPQTVFHVQVVICLALGTLSFLAFCIVRYRWPHIYAIRTLRRSDLFPIPKTIFGWVWVIVCKVREKDVLEKAGLDAYMYLRFFKMGMQMLFVVWCIAMFIITPTRWFYTGHMDVEAKSRKLHLWLYPVTTWVFSLLVVYLLLRNTERIVKVRQEYLASQNSVTDRTFRISGIPEEVDSEEVLKEYIEALGIGTVDKVALVYDRSRLRALYAQRDKIVSRLEDAYARYLPYANDVFSRTPSVVPARFPSTMDTASLRFNGACVQLDDSLERPTRRTWSGRKIDVIGHYSRQLRKLDQKIRDERCAETSKITAAFITMDNVASAQMAAQAVLDPRVQKLIVSLAPAPADVKWEYFSIPTSSRIVRSWLITLIIAVSSVALVFPVSSLAALLNVQTISKFWPKLGELILNSPWAKQIVTFINLLPPYLFTLLNVIIPYFYIFLSNKQGFVSNGDVELSAISKNFFYTFFNFFLVFTLAGAASNYWSFLSDTTKIAYQLAESVSRMSLFYVDLILLQGLGMFPVKLLQIGDVFVEGWYRWFIHTPRHLRSIYYKPPVFDFGLYLPQPLLILMITIIYSVLSTKIVTAGLVYFFLGYYTYKYQLMYTMVHPQHSTGRLWPLIVRRVFWGLFLFQLTMIGTLAAYRNTALTIALLPLLLLTGVLSYSFENHYLPLCSYIALAALKGVVEQSESEESSTTPLIRTRRSTIDEDRDKGKDYSDPYVVGDLFGPVVGFRGDHVQFIEYDDNGNEIVIDRIYKGNEWE